MSQVGRAVGRQRVGAAEPVWPAAVPFEPPVRTVTASRTPCRHAAARPPPTPPPPPSTPPPMPPPPDSAARVSATGTPAARGTAARGHRRTGPIRNPAADPDPATTPAGGYPPPAGLPAPRDLQPADRHGCGLRTRPRRSRRGRAGLVNSLGGQANLMGILSSVAGVLSILCCVCAGFGGGGAYFVTLPLSIAAFVLGVPAPAADQAGSGHEPESRDHRHHARRHRPGDRHLLRHRQCRPGLQPRHSLTPYAQTADRPAPGGGQLSVN